MTTPPLFSIIVPVYNVSEYLRRCLDSIINQSFKDFECLLIDDGSTDESPKICKKYAERDVRFRFYQKENGGVSTARNLGLENARGTWICFIDSDDYVETEYLSGFQRISNRGDLLCQGIIWCSIETGSKRELPLQERHVTKDKFAKPLIEMYRTGIYYFLMTKAFKREIITENHLLFDVSLRRRQDEMFINRYITKISSINLSSVCNYNHFLTSKERMKKMASIYDRLSFNIDSVTYYCLYKFCRNKDEFTQLSRICGERVLLRIFDSYLEMSPVRKKKEVLFLIKYIKPCKIHITLANSLRWRIFRPFLFTNNYYLTNLWLYLYTNSLKLYRHSC